MDVQAVEWLVSSAQSGQRLDRFLIARLPFCSRRELNEGVSRHRILVNGCPVPKGCRVHAGDRVTADIHTRLEPNPALEVPVLFEDDTCLVLDKPAGMPSVAVRLSDTHTAANYLTAAFPECLDAGPNRRDAGIVHRLDTATSGVLLAARTTAAYIALRAGFRRGSVYKEYRVIVDGACRLRGSFRFDLAPHGRRHRRMRIVSRGEGRSAVAQYWPLRVAHDRSLLRVVIETGVRHQIRAHLASLGHPVWGDALYGSRNAHGRLFLHAHALGFDHPVTRRWIHTVSPLPPDFRAVRPAAADQEHGKNAAAALTTGAL